MSHTHKRIRSKDVWITEYHHHVLEAWALLRQRIPAPPILITFDSHTDLLPAFRAHCCKLYPDDADEILMRFAEAESSKINFQSTETIGQAINNLRHDEHVHAAHLAGIIGDVFVSLGCQPGGDTPDSWGHVYYDSCLPPCDLSMHDEECQRRVADHVIDDALILDRIERIEQSLGRRLGETSYILDIDLDVFLTAAAVNPKNHTVIDRLIKNSLGITIAKESQCVKDLALEGEVLDSTMLLAAVEGIIDRALS